ncbi:MAG TPA: hypothetical protein VHW23_13740 [Kofleriaceae bacterium]|nr:hypothetical protein [Kofleriaceae bacterium]
MLRYKFVEVSTVTDEALEQTVNDWVAQGWQLDAIRFVITEHSRRPAMAFVSFIREVAGGGSEPPATPPHVIAAADNDVE